MNEFGKYHPLVNFLYFAAVITFSMLLTHPVCIAASLVCGIVYSAMLCGTKTLKFGVTCALPLSVFTVAVNILFNHEGATILRYFPDGNPLTLESVVYGTASAVMLAGTVYQFLCFEKIMTSDKFMFLFGKIIPSLSLILSMTLRLVPRFVSQLKETAAAQKHFACSSGSSPLKRIRHSARILSVTVTRSLENAIDTSDSMKSRGYGLPGRTAFSNYRLDRRDTCMLTVILFLTVYVAAGIINGSFHFDFYPKLNLTGFTLYGISTAAAYILLCMLPIIIEITEALRWKKLKSKI